MPCRVDVRTFTCGRGAGVCRKQLGPHTREARVCVQQVIVECARRSYGCAWAYYVDYYFNENYVPFQRKAILLHIHHHTFCQARQNKNRCESQRSM
jgi:hypothetical protein